MPQPIAETNWRTMMDDRLAGHQRRRHRGVIFTFEHRPHLNTTTSPADRNRAPPKRSRLFNDAVLWCAPAVKLKSPTCPVDDIVPNGSTTHFTDGSSGRRRRYCYRHQVDAIAIHTVAIGDKSTPTLCSSQLRTGSNVPAPFDVEKHASSSSRLVIEQVRHHRLAIFSRRTSPALKTSLSEEADFGVERPLRRRKSLLATSQRLSRNHNCCILTFGDSCSG